MLKGEGERIRESAEQRERPFDREVVLARVREEGREGGGGVSVVIRFVCRSLSDWDRDRRTDSVETRLPLGIHDKKENIFSRIAKWVDSPLPS